MRTVVATTGGGLGNRLLGLASVMILAAKADAELKVYWPEGTTGTGTPEGFFCPFSSLYKPPCQFITAVDRNQVLMKPHTHYSLEDQRTGRSPVSDTGTTYYYTHGAIREAATLSELRVQLEALRPSAAVRSKLATARTLLNDQLYDGLLVRCHGHPKARRWNPSIKFNQLLMTRPHNSPVSCYLACDDRSVTARLMAHPYCRTVVLPRPGRRNTEEELTTVAADIAILSRCERFYATPFCALTELIKVLRGDKEVIYPE